MNKLNSKNPVLRFKLGKLIIKALFGSIAPLISRTLLKRNGSFGNGRKDGKWVAGKFIPDKNNVLQKKQQSPKDYSFMKGGTRQRTPEELKKWEAEIQRQQNLTKDNSRKSSNKLIVSKLTPVNRLLPHFMKGYEEEISPYIGGAENIKATQLKLKDFYAPGTYKDDGIWGKNTQAAFEKYQESLSNKTPILQEPQSQSWFKPLMTSSPPRPTNFGYSTVNHYEDTDFSDKLKGLGIGSNSDLINWMNQTGVEGYDWKGNNWAKQFRSDINQALGGDYSDANIRNTFSTAGNWGRGSRGDYSDFLKALQINAGTWNGIHNLKMERFLNSKPMHDYIINYFAGNAPLTVYRPGLRLQSNFEPKLLYSKQGGQLISRNLVLRFKQGGLSPFGKAFKEARQQGLKTFLFNGKTYTTELKDNKKSTSSKKKSRVDFNFTKEEKEKARPKIVNLLANNNFKTTNSTYMFTPEEKASMLGEAIYQNIIAKLLPIASSTLVNNRPVITQPISSYKTKLNLKL